jgi:hypothetical protein
MRSEKLRNVLLFSGIMLFSVFAGIAAAQFDAENVRLVGHIGGDCYGVATQGNYAYVAEGFSLRILDMSNPSAPVSLSSVLVPDIVAGVYVAGNYAYVADRKAGLRIIDVSNPSAPFEAGFYNTPGDAMGVCTSGNYAYVADYGSGLRIINISDPANPVEEGDYDTPGDAYDVAVSGNYAYVADGGWGLGVIDVSDPAAPVEAGYCSTPDTCTALMTPRGLHTALLFPEVMPMWQTGTMAYESSTSALLLLLLK